MKFKKLNKNWNAEPHTPNPELITTPDSLTVTFFLNAHAFEHIDEHEKGVLEFYDVYMYRSMIISDDADFRERFPFTNRPLPWGDFYEVKDSGWETNFPADKIIVNNVVDKSELSHFIFLFQDQLIECIAGDYKFTFASQASEIAKAKYPGEYFSHFLGMFTSNFDAIENESFEAHIDLYLRLEGVDEFIGVLMELQQIQKNNDLGLFLKVVNEMEIENFGSDQLKDFIWIIQHYGKDGL